MWTIRRLAPLKRGGMASLWYLAVWVNRIATSSWREGNLLILRHLEDAESSRDHIPSTTVAPVRRWTSDHQLSLYTVFHRCPPESSDHGHARRVAVMGARRCLDHS